MRTMFSTSLFWQKACMSEFQHSMVQRVLKSVLHPSSKKHGQNIKRAKSRGLNNIRRNQSEGQI